MIAAYYEDDSTNKLSARISICDGRRKFIYEIMKLQKHFEKIKFFEMLRKLMWNDLYAADKILISVLNDLNNV